jgi:hypothetical protein
MSPKGPACGAYCLVASEDASVYNSAAFALDGSGVFNGIGGRAKDVEVLVSDGGSGSWEIHKDGATQLMDVATELCKH